MKVETLEIAKRPSYDTDYPNMLVGMVTLKGANGEQKIRLSNGALSRIFNVITEEVAATARDNARAVERGMQEAVDEPLLLSAQTVLDDTPF